MMNSVNLCTFNIINFPFDIQTCVFKFVITSTTLYTLDLALNQSNMKTDFYIGNKEWDLLSISVYEKDSMLDMLIILRRRPLFLTLTKIVPIVALSIINVIRETVTVIEFNYLDMDILFGKLHHIHNDFILFSRYTYYNATNVLYLLYFLNSNQSNGKLVNHDVNQKYARQRNSCRIMHTVKGGWH